MSNTFKVGDKIRLRQDYPNSDLVDNSFPHGFFNYERVFEVVEAHDGFVKIDGSYIEWMADRFELLS